jgi:hypothetical protein
MPIQGQLKGKIPKQITLQQNSVLRSSSERAPTDSKSPGVSTQEAPNADITAGVSNEDNKELLRKNSAILENLNLMYETIHNETQLLKTLKQESTTKEEPPIFEKKQVTPQQVTPQQNDKSARVLEPKKKTNKSTLPGVSKSMIPLFTQQRDKSRVAAVGPNADISAGVLKKKPQQPAPALLPRWR